jgi:hypothetical protein
MNLDRDGDGRVSPAEVLNAFLDNERIQQAIAIALTGCIIYEVRQGNIDAQTLVGIYGTILGFYFKSQIKG